MPINLPEKSFTIKVKGEVSEEEYAGVFKCRPALSHSLQLEKDRIRREYLGERPTEASPRAMNAAEIFSTLAVHITSAPAWWMESRGGIDLLDDQVIATIYGEVTKKIKEFHDELKTRAESARASLAKAEPEVK